MLNDCLETWWNCLYVTNRDTFPDHQISLANIYITFIHDKNLLKKFCLIKKTNGFWGKVNIFFSVYRWHYMIRCHYLLCRRNPHDSILWWNENYQLYMSNPTLSTSWVSYLIWELNLHQKHFDKTSKLSINFFFFSQYQFYAVFSLVHTNFMQFFTSPYQFLCSFSLARTNFFY